MSGSKGQWFFVRRHKTAWCWPGSSGLSWSPVSSPSICMCSAYVTCFSVRLAGKRLRDSEKGTRVTSSFQSRVHALAKHFTRQQERCGVQYTETLNSSFPSNLTSIPSFPISRQRRLLLPLQHSAPEQQDSKAARAQPQAAAAAAAASLKPRRHSVW